MFARISRSKLLGKKTGTLQEAIGAPASFAANEAIQENVEDERGWTKQPDGAQHRSGIRIDVLGNLYDPDNKRAHKRIVVDAKKRPDTGDIIGGRNHWRDLYGDYHIEDHDWADTIEHAERIISANLSGDNYYENVRRVCFRVDASAAQAAQVAKVLEFSFSYNPTGKKLRATRLWGIILRYCSSNAFVEKTTQTPFLRSIRKICQEKDGHAGLRSRMLEVIAGARLVYPESKAFRELWKSVKGAEDPAEGIPFRSPLFIVPNIRQEMPSQANESRPESLQVTVDSAVQESTDRGSCGAVGDNVGLPQQRSLNHRRRAETPGPEVVESDPSTTGEVVPPYRRNSFATVVSEAGIAPAYSEAAENWPSVVRHSSFAPPGYD